jgi:hypothetical protein
MQCGEIGSGIGKGYIKTDVLLLHSSAVESKASLEGFGVLEVLTRRELPQAGDDCRV